MEKIEIAMFVFGVVVGVVICMLAMFIAAATHHNDQSQLRK